MIILTYVVFLEIRCLLYEQIYFDDLLELFAWGTRKLIKNNFAETVISPLTSIKKYSKRSTPIYIKRLALGILINSLHQEQGNKLKK